DKTIIDKLIEASQAGVRIELIVRGICCLRPGIEGYTDHITVISVVGCFLEHSRIYRFGVGKREQIYIASADFMTRNTLRRVEVAAPIYDRDLKARIRHIFDTIMRDDEKGRELLSDGSYTHRCINKTPLNSQELFYEEAYRAAETGRVK
ncbi:MAG: polyphosphate kinase 1, partial [Clostridiales bacterium]|nr:polyphosphate kinase 1 [Clostridiales bacterium]